METEKDFCREITQFLRQNLGENYNIQEEVPFSSSLGSNSRRFHFDFMISKNGTKSPIMLGEIKNNHVSIREFVEFYFNLFSRTSAKYGVFIDLDHVYLADFSDTSENPYKIIIKGSWDSCRNEIINLITKVTPDLTTQKFLEEFKGRFKEMEKGWIENPEEETIQKEEIKKFFEDIDSKDLIKKDSSVYFTPGKEDELFSILFPSSTENKFCRYVSFESLFRTLNEEKWTMAGLVGMNDKSETFFIERVS